MAAFNLSLPKLQISLDRAWRDPIYNSQFMAKTAALTAQLQRQTIQVSDFITGSGRNAKQLTKTIFWPVSCAVTTGACTDECLVSTTEATDSSQDIVLTCLRQVGFKETMKRFRNSPLDYEKTIALMMLTHMKALDEYLTQQYIAFLLANAGDHGDYALSVGSLVGVDWEIPATEWNAELMAEFVIAAELARFGNPYILDGLNFASAQIIADANSGNLDGKGVSSLFNEFGFVRDIVNMTAAAPGRTFMVNASAVAFVSGNYWDTTPAEYAPGHRVWKQQSKNLPGVWYDVHEIEACTSNDFVDSFQIRVNGAFALNPLGCDAGTTGILSFEKLAGV